MTTSTAQAGPTPLLDQLSPMVTRTLRRVAEELRLSAWLEPPRSSEALATAWGFHPDACRRFLRCLAMFGDITEVSPGVFGLARELTDPSAAVPAQRPESVSESTRPNPAPVGWQRDLLADGRAARFARIFGPEGLRHSLRTGRPAFDEVFGMGAFKHFATDPATSASLHTMTETSTRSTAAAIVSALEVERFDHVSDLGGGNAILAEAILTAHARPTVTVLDEAAGAEKARGRLSETPAHAGRWSVVAGSFFEAVPADVDAYILKNVLHDWDDAACVDILERCRRALRPGGRVFVVERPAPVGFDGTASARDVAISDILLLLLSDGGRERTATEYGDLLARAGLVPVGSPRACTGTDFAVIEAAVGSR